jgi:uncharacterized protein YciI
MPLYAVIGFDHPPHSMPLRDEFRAEHRSFALENDRGTRLAGAMFDAQGNQCGTLMICEAASAGQVRELYRREPFYRNNVYKEFHVVEWHLALNRLEPTGGWLPNYPTRLART